MRKDPALSYRGALQLLGKHDRPVLDALDRLLGGVILASPLSPVAALWGWVDQKGEALGLVRKVLDAGTDKLLRTGGYQRQQLLTAAHTVLAVTAFFDALADHLGRAEYRGLRLTGREKLTLAAGSPVTIDVRSIEALYTAPAPLPGATALAGPAPHLSWFEGLADRTVRFVVDLFGAGAGPTSPAGRLARDASDRYWGSCLRLAGEVPEFAVWLTLNGQADLGSRIGHLRDDVRAVLEAQGGALRRVEDLLALTVAAGSPEEQATRTTLHRANWGVLREPIMAGDTLRHVAAVRFPPVGALYVEPRYRWADHGAQAEPSREDWWDRAPVRDDLDVFLAAHLMSPASTELPMLLLGHPGAGKSLLTKVLAARLPIASHTVVRVPLRRVDADAPVYEQIQQALNATTHRRVEWPDLVEESRDTIRVVLLDGLDELIQATASGRPGYLQEVAEFQRREADQERPVAVVVTTRTVVADRVRIPDGTPMLRLEEFDDAQVSDWLAKWNALNASHRIGTLSPEIALGDSDLARQPLLLLMLALYAADPEAPALDERLSSAALYGRLLENFVRRQVVKTADAEAIDDAVREELWRLGVAAFAMFNRGRLDIAEPELDLDLAALIPDVRQTDRLGQRTIGQFFFVYTAEADAHQGDRARRAFEFLHATFGEYLIAHHVVELLAELADARRANRRSGRDIDDDLLFALLSHEPLAARQNILTLAAELLSALPEERHAAVDEVLETLLRSYRHRQGTEAYARYEPRPVDRVRELAAYSANLASLRAFSRPGGVPTTRLAEDWPATVRLWRAGLDHASWLAVATALDLDDDLLVRRTARWIPAQYPDIYLAQLVNDTDVENWLRWGLATEGGLYISVADRNPSEVRSFLIQGILWGGARVPEIDEMLERTARELDATLDPQTRILLARYLAANARHLAYEHLRVLVELLLLGDPGFPELAIVVAARPRLLLDLPVLTDVRWFLDADNPVQEPWIPLVLRAAAAEAQQAESERLDQLRDDLAPFAGAVTDSVAIQALLGWHLGVDPFRGRSGPSTPPPDPGSAGPPSPPSSPGTASR
jgi:hypothetical protein